MAEQWVEGHKEHITLFFLPSCSPEKNPDEYLNRDIKQGLSMKPSPGNQEKLSENLKQHMDMLQSNPQRVRKYFQHEDIGYAA